MASLDNCRDLLDLIADQDINYVLLTLQKDGEKPGQYLKINFDCVEDEIKPVMINVLQEFIEDFKSKKSPSKKKEKKKTKGKKGQ